jgi:hypothetical protein
LTSFDEIAPGLSRAVWLALPKITDRPERIFFVRNAMGEPNARNGLKPARIKIVDKRRPVRAEFFALPIAGRSTPRGRLAPSGQDDFRKSRRAIIGRFRLISTVVTGRHWLSLHAANFA